MANIGKRIIYNQKIKIFIHYFYIKYNIFVSILHIYNTFLSIILSVFFKPENRYLLFFNPLCV